MNTPTISMYNQDSDSLNTFGFLREVRKIITSKDFKGGKVSNLFGETRLDFSNADISGIVILDISQAFGEVNLCVPPTWQVKTDLSQFLASTRDKREADVEPKNSDKVLMIIGNSVFGAVQITNGL